MPVYCTDGLAGNFLKECVFFKVETYGIKRFEIYAKCGIRLYKNIRENAY